MKLPPRRSGLLICVFCLACILHSGLTAEELAPKAQVRTTLRVDGDVWVGQKVIVVVELIAPGYFASAPSFDLPHPQSVLLMPPLDSPVLDNETIDDTIYTVQQYELSAYPMKEGEQLIPAFTIRFSYKSAPLDSEETSASVQTTPQAYSVKRPPGTEKLGQLISTQNLEIEETWNPEPSQQDVIAGTAFTRTVSYTAPNIPGMLFPPFAAGTMDGIGIYMKRQTFDHSVRGMLQGKREDVITYVCERPGQFTIAAAQFHWFDIESHKIRTIEFPAYTFSVVANPALASQPTEGAGESIPPGSVLRTSWKFILVIVAIVAIITMRIGPQRLSSLASNSAFWPRHLQPLNPWRIKSLNEHAYPKRI